MTEPIEPATEPRPTQDAEGDITVSAAKGRPMLTWVGKRPLARLSVFPAQLVELFDPTRSVQEPQDASLNRLYHGDNKETLAHLIANGYRGQVKLIYIDPPFDSGADYVRKVRLRGANADRLSGEGYSLGEQVQYTDIWANDNYLQFMYERLPLMRELLAEEGSIWLHCDHRKVHHLRLLLEEVFGPENYLNTISWRSQVARGAKVNAFYFPFSTHYIEIFAKNRAAPTTWNPQKRQMRMDQEEVERAYMHDERGYFRTSDPGSYSFESLKALVAEGRLYAPFGGQVVVDEDAGRVYASNGGNLGVKYYVQDLGDGAFAVERAIDNLWDDIPGLGTTPGEDVGYPTQKTEALLERIITVSTDPGDLVLDCFLGSGTTPVVAQKLGRRWIGCDINRGSIQTASKRLQALIAAQVEANTTPGDPPAFGLYRVNQYDPQPGEPALQPALRDLVCQHVGIQPSRRDGVFDGTLGARLAKVISLDRPLTPADLDDLIGELAARPDETRDLVVVCLGKELAVDEWQATWNALRKPGRGLNHLEIIELRSDARYGNFLTHTPAQARVSVSRSDEDAGKLVIEIVDFISPTIIERLRIDGGIGAPQIDDWRAMVDNVAIDTAYDGALFRAVFADVPLKKSDCVTGRYQLAAPSSPTTVAVKITDMLGEELLVVSVV